MLIIETGGCGRVSRETVTGTILAICNQKGGVGKTTTAINLAAYLARQGQRVLLVDIDPQGNATSGLGIDKQALTQTVYHALITGTEISQVIVNTDVKGLSLAPASTDLTGAEIELVSRMAREFVLREILSTQTEQYEYVLIDCPPSLGLLTINGLSAAQQIIIPVQCEFYALEGLSQLLATIDLVRNNLNPGLSICGLLLTMADYRTNLTHEVIAEVRNISQERIFSAVIPRSVRLSEAPSFGKPIVLYDAQSIGARHYEELAREILNGPQRPPTQTPHMESQVTA